MAAASIFSPWARIGSTPRLFPSGAILTALARRPGRIELYGAGIDGGIWTVTWSEQARGSGWGEWSRIGAAAHINSPPNLGPAAVARGPAVVDLVTLSADGTIWTTSGDPERAFSPTYRPIGRENRFVPGTALTAVAPDVDHLRVFAVGADGEVWTNAWDRERDWGTWAGIGPENLLATRRHHMLSTGRRQRIAAVAVADRCDVFVVDRGGRVRTVALASGVWGYWATIGDACIFEPESQLTALSIDRETILLAAPARDGSVYTTLGHPRSGFRPWTPHGPPGILGAEPRTAVTAISRRPGEIELFVAGADGFVYASAGSISAGLSPFARLEGSLGNVPPNTILAAASCRPERVDLFCVRGEGLVHGAMRRDFGARASIPPTPVTLRTPSPDPAAETVVILGPHTGARALGGAEPMLAEVAELEALRKTKGGVARRHALLVGVNAYVDPELPPLRFCVSDVLALGEALRAGGYASVTTLHDGAAEPHLRPTRENIKVELLELVESLEPDDLVLVHFSCHGALIGGKPHLLPANARTRILAESSLAVDDVTRILAQSAARCVLVVLDACHTGADFGRDDGPPSLTPECVHEVRDLAAGMKVLAGPTSQEAGKDREEGARGAFTSFVIEALTRAQGFSPADRDHKGFVTFDDLKGHVSRGLMEWSRRHGVDLRRPNETGVAAGSMIVVDFRG